MAPARLQALARGASLAALLVTFVAVGPVACASKRPPASPGHPAAAPAPSPAGPSARPGKLDLSTFWTPWFDGYQYMFVGPGSRGWEHSPALANEGRVFGAGVSGFWFYGGLDDCLRAALPIDTVYDGRQEYESLAIMAGRPFRIGQVGSGWQRGFGRYDPAVIDWAVQTLVPSPRTPFMGETFQQSYDRTFFRVVRLHALTYALLRVRYDLDVEAAAYLEAMENDPDFDGIYWLEARYGGALDGAWPLPMDGTNLTGEMVMGFWLRRHVDGTEQALVDGLGVVLHAYDADFLDELGAGATLFDPPARR